MPLACPACDLPRQAGLRFVAKLGLGLLIGGSLAACATSSYPPFGPPNALHLSPDQSEIILTGEMKDGLATQVKQMIEANPHINAIELESPGGSGNEGYRLALLVKQHHLATFSAKLCASACTFVYVAGEPRFLGLGGKLGFHSSSVNGVKSVEGNAFSQVLYQEAGVPQAFIDRALQTAPDDIWFPEVGELMKSRVVTDIVPDQYFVPSSRKYWTTDEELDRALKTDGVIAAVKRLDPENYKKIREIFVTGARQGRGIAQIAASSREFISDHLMPSYYRRAPDDLVIAYRRLQLDAVRYVEKNAAGSCVAVASPKGSISEFSNEHLSAKLNEQLDQVMTAIITAAVPRPDHPGDDVLNKRTAAEFEKTTLTKAQDYTKNVEALKRDKYNQGLYCQVIESYLETVLNQPPATAARIIRSQELKQDDSVNRPQS
jgi:hypothetical protein